MTLGGKRNQLPDLAVQADVAPAHGHRLPSGLFLHDSLSNAPSDPSPWHLLILSGFWLVHLKVSMANLKPCHVFISYYKSLTVKRLEISGTG